MRRSALAAVALAAGCKVKDNSFPIWSDGIQIVGDCQDDYEIVDGTATSVVSQLPDPGLPSDPVGSDPLWHMDALPDPAGTIIRDVDAYNELWFDTMNFGSWPVVDFETDQAIFAWVRNPDGCAISIDEWHVNTKADLGVVLDVTFFDETMNCPDTCGTDVKAMVMVAIDRELDASFCRRIRPGCEPTETTSP